jgi:hypothetical protein
MSVNRIVRGVIWGLFVGAVAFVCTSCSAFSSQDASFVAYNTSDHAVEFHVNDGAGYQVGPQSTTSFTVQIPVPRNPVNSYGGPSAIDKTVEVSVAVKDLGTGELTRPTMCQSGAKIIAHLTYYKSPYGDSYVICQSSY